MIWTVQASESPSWENQAEAISAWMEQINDETNWTTET